MGSVVEKALQLEARVHIYDPAYGDADAWAQVQIPICSVILFFADMMTIWKCIALLHYILKSL